MDPDSVRQSVGGRTKHMDRVTAWRFLNPPMSFAKGMVVNKMVSASVTKWFMELPWR